MALTKPHNRMIQDAPIKVSDYIPNGTVLDGSYDCTSAINAAIADAQTQRRNLYFGSGIFAVSSTIVLSGNGIALIGEGFSSPIQGQIRPATTIRWTGGASPIFDLQLTFFKFVGFAIENFGTATDAFLCTSTQHLTFDNISFGFPTGHVQYSRAAIYCDGNELGYSVIQNCEVLHPAEYFVKYDGNSTPNGVTPIYFYNNHFSSLNVTNKNFTVLFIEDENFDIISFVENTFDTQAGSTRHVIVDSETAALSKVCSSFLFERNEVDISATLAGSERIFKLKNFVNCSLNNNQMQLGGAILAAANLTNSSVTSFVGNNVRSLAGEFFTADATSFVESGLNVFDSNTRTIVNNSAAFSGLIPVTYGATCRIRGAFSGMNRTCIYQINATNSSAFNIVISGPLDSVDASFMTRGQVFGVQIKNTSGGALGTITQGTNIKVNGSAFPSPANGNSQTVMFVWDGTNAIEIGRTSGDIPN